jgi:hypothetical protein
MPGFPLTTPPVISALAPARESNVPVPAGSGSTTAPTARTASSATTAARPSGSCTPMMSVVPYGSRAASA